MKKVSLLNGVVGACIALLFVGQALAGLPTALVYRGPGACEDGCVQGAAHVAEMMGYQVRYVGPSETATDLFQGAKLWLQPGGRSSVASKAMLPALKENIRTFVAAGGGYVGFCAGGFIATKMIAERGVEGLGLLPGSNALYPIEDAPAQIPVKWTSAVQGEQLRDLYWEGGPYFIPPAEQSEADQYEVVAHYENGLPAAVRAQYGLGRVFVTGPHPEAPLDWRTATGVVDSDGMDWDLAAEMLRWARAAH